MKRVFYLLQGSLILHLVISLVFILDPPFLTKTTISRIYKSYLLPGPFFRDDRIVDSNMLYVSWKVDNEWTTPINPAFNSFKKYHSTFNPACLYRSRLERTLFVRPFYKKDLSHAELLQERTFIMLREYLEVHFIPSTTDSVRMLFVNREAKNLEVSLDSIDVILRR